MKKVVIKDVVLGEGRMKICVPLVGRTEAQIKKEVEWTKKFEPEFYEWRMDFFENLWVEYRGSWDEYCDIHFRNIFKHILGDILKDLRVVVTARTTNEGGNVDIDDETYCECMSTMIAVIKELDAQDRVLVDVEAGRGVEAISGIIHSFHKRNIKVIASSHDFSGTPRKTDIITILKRGEGLGGDIAKCAFMPKTEADVDILLNAVREASRQLDIPVIGISMGELGQKSRVDGARYGSCLTFAKGFFSSAPGQLGIEELREAWDVMGV